MIEVTIQQSIFVLGRVLPKTIVEFIGFEYITNVNSGLVSQYSSHSLTAIVVVLSNYLVSRKLKNKGCKVEMRYTNKNNITS